jgi:hypothetical protein
MKRPVALLLPLALALAACGGDDAGGDAGGDATGNDIESWCGVAQELSDLSDTLDDIDPFDPPAIETAYGELRSTADRARSAAPAEIRADVELLADGVAQIDDALAAADYNFLDVDLAFMDDFGDEFDEASDRLDAFNVRECGFDPDDQLDGDLDVGGGDAGTDDADDDHSRDDLYPAAGPVRDQIVGELVAGGFTSDEAECIIDNLDMAGIASAPDDPMAMIEVFDMCDISLERLLELDG